jgi:hypothetical protein
MSFRSQKNAVRVPFFGFFDEDRFFALPALTTVETRKPPFGELFGGGFSQFFGFFELALEFRIIFVNGIYYPVR